MAVHNLQHFSLIVPDLTVARRFYEDAGMQTFMRDGALVARCFGRDQDQVVLLEGKRKRLNYVSFGTDDAGFVEAKARLEAQGVALEDAPEHVVPEGIWFRDFEGLLTNLRVAAEAPWDTKPRVTFNPVEDRTQRRGRTELIAEEMIRPRRLGHIVTFTTDPERKLEFYRDVFGLKLTDKVASFLSFLHSPIGSDHHIIAVGKSETYGLHHAGFDAGSSDEAAAAGRMMIDKGYIRGWGPGRHFAGSNVFAYIRDPWNSMFEYFADMDYIHPEANWEPQDWSHVGKRSIWGESEPEDFATNFEALELRKR